MEEGTIGWRKWSPQSLTAAGAPEDALRETETMLGDALDSNLRTCGVLNTPGASPGPWKNYLIRAFIVSPQELVADLPTLASHVLLCI